MTAVAGEKGQFELGSLNDSTGWIDIRGVAFPHCFDITGTFSGTVTLQESNQEAFTKTRFSTRSAYTAPTSALQYQPCVTRFIRFIMTSYVSGKAYVGLARAKDSAGEPFDLAAQSPPSNPSSQFS